MSRYLQVLAIGVILGGLTASAQVSTGTISGVVQDQSGAIIAGAMVTVRNVDTGAVRTLTSDAGAVIPLPIYLWAVMKCKVSNPAFRPRSGVELHSLWAANRWS